MVKERNYRYRNGFGMRFYFEFNSGIKRSRDLVLSNKTGLGWYFILN